MKKCNTPIKEILIFIAIVATFVIPPLFFTGEFTLPEKPSNITKWLKFIALTMVIASYEEILYRYYLPSRLILFFKNNTVIKLFAAEIIPVLLFGFAHRYLGCLNILYAIIMGGLFRLVFLGINKKTNNTVVAFITVVLIHFIHNLVVYAYLFYKI